MNLIKGQGTKRSHKTKNKSRGSHRTNIKTEMAVGGTPSQTSGGHVVKQTTTMATLGNKAKLWKTTTQMGRRH